MPDRSMPIVPSSLDTRKKGIEYLNSILKTADSRLKRLMERRRAAISQYRQDVTQLRISVSLAANCQSALKAVQTVAQEIQQQIHRQIASVTSRCLTAVFDEPYEFKIRFEQRRGRTEADLFFVRDGHEINPSKAAGGGVADVASFALRLACVSLARPPLRKILVLDEPFKFVSKAHIPRVKAMLDMLASELGVQIIMVTHIAGLCGDNTIEIGD